jgi:outer membrane biosynthesis protein TonB
VAVGERSARFVHGTLGVRDAERRQHEPRAVVARATRRVDVEPGNAEHVSHFFSFFVFLFSFRRLDSSSTKKRRKPNQKKEETKKKRRKLNRKKKKKRRKPKQKRNEEKKKKRKKEKKKKENGGT